MAEHSHIEWTDATWNPVTGCSVVSPGCTNCYAMRLAGTRLADHPSRMGLTAPSKAGPVWNGRVRFNTHWLSQPARWRRGRRIFVCAHGDLFHESVPDAWIDRVFTVMASERQHIYQVLTKRAARMRRYVLGALEHPPFAGGLPPNIWLGVSAEDQARADERIPELLATPAPVRFLSAEPLLGPVDITNLSARPFNAPGGWFPLNALAPLEAFGLAALDWVIAGGESGPGARPMHPDWARKLRDDCAAAGVPFFFKQWGAWAACSGDDGGEWPIDAGWFIRLAASGERAADGWPMQRVGKRAAGRLLDGRVWDEMPGAA